MLRYSKGSECIWISDENIPQEKNIPARCPWLKAVILGTVEDQSLGPAQAISLRLF
jgi:hypothetical protein